MRNILEYDCARLSSGDFIVSAKPAHDTIWKENFKHHCEYNDLESVCKLYPHTGERPFDIYITATGNLVAFQEELYVPTS
jgi:alanine-alpha-ketoisovalerate/valine-pyruvate aminotransferase